MQLCFPAKMLTFLINRILNYLILNLFEAGRSFSFNNPMIIEWLVVSNKVQFQSRHI